MNFQTYNGCDILIRTEIEFLRFYHDLMVDSLERMNFESKMYSLEKVRDAYCKYSLQNGVSNVSFDNSGIRAAYIFSSVPCFSGSMFYYFQNLIHLNPWFLKKVIAQKSLTISCLGGGPGTEVLAIAKALEFNLKMFCLNIGPVTIHAKIIDSDSGWKDMLKLITHKWWKFFDRNYIRLDLSFVECDLTQELSEDVQDVVKKSDMVTMVHFVSAVYGTKCREKISKMLQEIMNHMDENGVILYVNCSRFSCIKELSDIIASSIETEVIYGPIYDDVYQLSQPCLQECHNLYARHFGNVPPIQQSKNHVVAWRKIRAAAHS